MFRLLTEFKDQFKEAFTIAGFYDVDLKTLDLYK